jgi:hypothetical protein
MLTLGAIRIGENNISGDHNNWMITLTVITITEW